MLIGVFFHDCLSETNFDEMLRSYGVRAYKILEAILLALAQDLYEVITLS